MPAYASPVDILAATVSSDDGASTGEHVACAMAVSRARSALELYLGDVRSKETWPPLVVACAAASKCIAQLPRHSEQTAAVLAARELIRRIAEAPLNAQLSAESVQNGSLREWPALLSCMLTKRAWRVTGAPSLEQVPNWLWGDYSAWIFSGPAEFESAESSEAFAAHFARRSEELARWVRRNPGSAAVQSAWNGYLPNSHLSRLLADGAARRKSAEAHFAMLCHMRRGRAIDAPLSSPRLGRKLRIGYIAEKIDDSLEGFAALPLAGQLDPERFEVQVFVFQASDSRVERTMRESAYRFHVLEDLATEQAAVITGAQLDCLVFGGVLAGEDGALAGLASQRLAPVQIATSEHNNGTTGYDTIDLFVTGSCAHAADLATHFTERLAFIDGPVRTLNLEATSAEPVTLWTREMLGLPVDSVVFVAIARFECVSAETRVLWASALKGTPNSYLVIVSPTNGDITAETLDERFEGVLTDRGVQSGRLKIVGDAVSSLADQASILAVCDVYLDIIPSGDELTLAVALQNGIPVVTMSGAQLAARQVAALLRSIERDEWVAANGDAYVETAVRLGTGNDARISIGNELRKVMECRPRALDLLATADAFGAILEVAFDEIADSTDNTSRGRKPLVMEVDPEQSRQLIEAAAFSFNDTNVAQLSRAVLRASPTDFNARILLGRSLLSMRDHSRAVDYLLAAVETGKADAAAWFDLARALDGNNQFPQAVQALEAGLRLDPSLAAGWLMLIDFSERAGSPDMARDALAELRKQIPDHPDLDSIAARIAC
jgi:protein O-GlcNAc transferase